jgi:hypothetical protein
MYNLLFQTNIIVLFPTYNREWNFQLSLTVFDSNIRNLARRKKWWEKELEAEICIGSLHLIYIQRRTALNGRFYYEN